MQEKLIYTLESIRKFIKREDGASAIEYALIAGLIAVGIISAATLLGEEITTVFETITDELSGVRGE